jgi:hypothetical protein
VKLAAQRPGGQTFNVVEVLFKQLKQHLMKFLRQFLSFKGYINRKNRFEETFLFSHFCEVGGLAA